MGCGLFDRVVLDHEAHLCHSGSPSPRVPEAGVDPRRERTAPARDGFWQERPGDDMPDINGWTWGQKAVVQRAGSTEADNV